jgi:hypothetical protein
MAGKTCGHAHNYNWGNQNLPQLFRHLDASCVEGRIKTDLVEIRREDGEWVYLAQDRSCGGLL